MTALVQELQAIFGGAGTSVGKLLGTDARMALLAALVDWGHEGNATIWPSEIGAWETAIDWIAGLGTACWATEHDKGAGNPYRAISLYRAPIDGKVYAVGAVRYTLAEVVAFTAVCGSPLLIIAAHGPNTQFERVI